MPLTAFGVWDADNFTRVDAINAALASRGLGVGYVLRFWDIDADYTVAPSWWDAKTWGPYTAISAFRSLVEPTWAAGGMPVVSVLAHTHLHDFVTKTQPRWGRVQTNLIDPIAAWMKDASGQFTGRRVILELWNEMNWSGNPWGPPATTPAQFVEAFQNVNYEFYFQDTRLRDYVTFCYCPNRVPDTAAGLAELRAYYPGDAWCDLSGADVFSQVGCGAEIYEDVATAVMPTVNFLRRTVCPTKPVLISQVGIAYGVSAAVRMAWAQSLLATIQGDHKGISGFIWWDAWDYLQQDPACPNCHFEFTTRAGDASLWPTVLRGYNAAP